MWVALTGAYFLAIALTSVQIQQTAEDTVWWEQPACAEAEAAQTRLEMVLSNLNKSFVVVDSTNWEQAQALSQQ
ncbi:hypothetical protein K9N68_34780 (plasmid) [Kovacikia minuta CCNUW1]|uniref:hypothetical protein n=1 Tax=Kovacikia minuta TaxID=2931930 RepID=UPI001CCDC2BB|nr:hypothetical protein [Kovacikia minuta]UBF30370.1 hypothetical protein K9N68_34780 [Kovacikia minuta CCNUW1]